MFNADGSLRTPDPADEEEASAVSAEPKPEPQPEPKPQPRPEPGPEPAAPHPAEEHELPPERPGEPSLFSDLVVNLASQAAMYMGLVDNPLAPKMPTDIHAARQMIDILGMLQQKTRGNLTADEDVLLERILTDLRMQYVAMATTRR
jgi:outer membrane biosynthesis protein TonB